MTGSSKPSSSDHESSRSALKKASNVNSETTASQTTTKQVPSGKDGLEEVSAAESFSGSRESQRADLFTAAIYLCIGASLLDMNQLHVLSFAARKCGGFYFIVAYVVISSVIGFALFNHLVHIAQFTQSGITKVFGIHAEAFRCVGFGMLAVVVLQMALYVVNSASMLAYVAEIYDDPGKTVTCGDWPEFECQGEVQYLRKCCASLHVSLQCQAKNASHVVSLGNVCMQKYPRNTYVLLASQIYEQNQVFAKMAKGSFDTTYFLAVLIVLVLVTGLACLGVRIFTYVTSGIFCVTLFLLVGYIIGMLAFGDLMAGLESTWRLTQPERLLSYKTIYYIFTMLLPFTSLKFPIISIASYLPRKNFSFTSVACVYFGQIALNLLLLLADVSFGHRSALTHRIHRSAYRDRSDHMFYREVIPEFFSTFLDNPFGFFFYMYYVMTFLINFGPICGAFFVCFTLVRDHFWEAGAWLEKVVCAAMSIVTLVFLVAVQLVRRDVLPFEFVMATYGCVFLAIGLVATVSVYGRTEVLLDLSLVHSRGSRFLHPFGPHSPFRTRLLENVLPLVLLLLPLAAFPLLSESLAVLRSSVLQLITLYTICLIPLAVLLSYFGYDVYFAVITNMPFWRMLYPGWEHPSYCRIMGQNGSETDQSERLLSSKKKL